MMRSIKSWLHDHPYSYALFYFIPYLIIFELLETFVVPKYYIHCFIDEMCIRDRLYLGHGSAALSDILFITCCIRHRYQL